MYFKEYQKLAMRTAPSNHVSEQLTNGCFGLAGECGEAIDIVKKYLFQGHDLDHTKLIKELGDILWYITLLAKASGSSLEQVARINIEKLEKRYPDGCFNSSNSINRGEQCK